MNKHIHEVLGSVNNAALGKELPKQLGDILTPLVLRKAANLATQLDPELAEVGLNRNNLAAEATKLAAEANNLAAEVVLNPNKLSNLAAEVVMSPSQQFPCKVRRCKLAQQNTRAHSPREDVPHIARCIAGMVPALCVPVFL